jgi:hypothetical protein
MVGATTPDGALAKAILDALKADATLATLAAGGVHSAMPEDRRIVEEYIVVGHRAAAGEAGTMGTTETTAATVNVDVWSLHNGPSKTQAVQARIRAVLRRGEDLAIAGYVLTKRSLVCAMEEVFPDADQEMAKRSGYHGVQRWTGELEEVI